MFDCRRTKYISGKAYNLLNLPEEIIFENGNKIKYYYDASGTKWRKEVNGSDTSRTDYVGAMILENDTLKQIQTAEGRIVADTAGQGYTYHYQYYLKDHLGNVRLTFGAEPDTTTYTATMESENASEEEQYFDNIDGLIGTGLNTTPGGNEVLVLDGSEQTGGNFTAKVQAGDVINIEVQAAYESGSNYSNTTGVAAMITSIAAGFGGVLGAGGESGLIYSAINNALGVLGFGGSQGSDEPAAYLTYLVYDDDLTYQFGGYTDISGNSSGVMQQFSIPNINIAKSGYIYVYLSNESTAQENAFYDDLKITHTSSLTIVQADDYYPFGLSFNSFMDTTETKQNYLYQGKEIQSDLGLNTYDSQWRMYDPVLARTWQIDPHSENYYRLSPFSWAANNPLKFIDFDGRDIVGTDGKSVTYKMVNGQAVWSKNTSVDVRRVGNALLRTETGGNQLNKAMSSNVKISITVSNKSVKTESGFKAGKTKYGDVTKSKSTGKYKAGSAEITIYEGSIEDLRSGEHGSNDFSESGVNQEGGVGAAAGHEIEHAINPDNVDQAYKNKLEGQNNDIEATPNEVHKQILKEEKEN